MPPSTPKWYLDTSNSDYRTIRAKEKISRFELIKETEVLSLALLESKRNKFCVNCLKESSELFKCSECSVFYYCNSECQKQDWLHFHKSECLFFRKFPSKDLCYELILNLRLYIIYRENEVFRAKIIKMKSHESAYTEPMLVCMKDMAKRVIEILGEDPNQIPVLFEVICKIKINFFTIEKPSYITNLAIGIGFYEGEVNYLNHSCFPNAFKIFNGRKMKIFASQDINQGEEILICYDDILGKPYDKRQKYLKDNYKMICGCKMCQKEKESTDFYPNISLLCQKCPEKGLINNNACIKCLHLYKKEELAHLHCEIEESIENMLKNKKFEEILIFLEDLKKNKLGVSSYLIEFLLSQIIHKYLETLSDSHTKILYKILKFYVRNYSKWFEIQFPSLGFKYYELSKLALVLKKGKKAKFFCEEAWRMINLYFSESQPELIELKKRMKVVDALLDLGNELKKTENIDLLRID